MGDGQGLVDTFGIDFIFGQLKVGPGGQSQLAEFVHVAFFHQLVAVGGGAGIEPEPGKPEEQKNSSRHQQDAQ